MRHLGAMFGESLEAVVDKTKKRCSSARREVPHHVDLAALPEVVLAMATASFRERALGMSCAPALVFGSACELTVRTVEDRVLRLLQLVTPQCV